LALRTLMMGAYYGNSGTWNAVKYPGPPAGIFDSQAPVWKGGTETRPLGNGTFIEEAPVPPQEPSVPAPEATQ
jgi:hypothetical protein